MKNAISRREFAKVSGAAATLAAALPANRVLGETGSVETVPAASQIAFLSDTHISADPNAVARGVKMAEHLETVVGQVVDRMPRGSHVIINGDCAYLRGLAGDYETLARFVAPITDAGLRLHVTLGNHDDRTPMYDLLPTQRENDQYVGEKHVDVIELPEADLVLLDSLWKVDVVTGEFGAAQLDWFESWLEQDSSRPVIVVGHHNLQFTLPKTGMPVTGLSDSRALTELLAMHPRVKAYVYGHTHTWQHTELKPRERVEASTAGTPVAAKPVTMKPVTAKPVAAKLDLVNLPPVSYVFDRKQPSGWVHGRFSSKSMDLTVHTLDETHPSHQEQTAVSLS